RPELDLASIVAKQAAADMLYTLVGEEAFGKFSVLATDVGQPVDQASPSEKLRFQPLAPRAALQQRIDEQLHRVNAMTLRFPVGALRASARQQEMVHAADPCNSVTHAGGNATAQYGRQHRIR